MTRDLLVAPLKMLCPETLLNNLDLDIGNKSKKIKKNCLNLIKTTLD